MAELTREPGSHLVADLNGYSKAATDADVATMLLLEVYLNTHRDVKKQPKPIVLPHPWDAVDAPETVTADERAALRADLAARSAMRDL